MVAVVLNLLRHLLVAIVELLAPRVRPVAENLLQLHAWGVTHVLWDPRHEPTTISRRTWCSRCWRHATTLSRYASTR